MRQALLICLLLPIVIYAADRQSSHIGAADMECSTCHTFCLNGIEGHLGTDGSGCAYCHHWTVVDNDLQSVTVPENADCTKCHRSSVNFRINGAHESQTCTTCHTPHDSDQGYLLRGSINNLCTGNCHRSDQLGRSHPRGSGAIDVHTGSEISCTSTCHSIHTTSSEKLLTASPPYLCASCHTDKL